MKLKPNLNLNRYGWVRGEILWNVGENILGELWMQERNYHRELANKEKK